MRLATELNQQLQQLAEQPRTAQALADFRQRNQQLLAANPLPTKFAETWKYTKLQPLADGHLNQLSPAKASTDELPEFELPPLVIINGRLPDTLPDWPGVSLSHIGDHTPALAKTTFSYANGATLEDGLLIEVAADAQPQSLFHVIFYSSADAPCHHNTRLRVELGANSKLQLIEHYMGKGPALSNSVTEIFAADNSELTHCRLQSEAEDTLHIGELAIRQERNSRVNSYQFSTASRLKRNDIHIIMAGQGSELMMAGAFIARGRSHIDNQICVDHEVSHCRSDQSYRGIAGDKGHAIFNGRIHILANASQTNADLSNKNLLLSPGAEIDSKPELVIYNDDVKCSHGTTIGQIDPEMQFYLHSRGIDPETAQRMLSLGFIQQQLTSLPFDSLRDWIGQWLGSAVTEVR